MKKLQKLLLVAMLCGMAAPIMDAAMGPGDDDKRGEKRKHEGEGDDGNPYAKCQKVENASIVQAKKASDGLGLPLLNSDCLALVFDKLYLSFQRNFALLGSRDDSCRDGIAAARPGIQKRLNAMLQKYPNIIPANGLINQNCANLILCEAVSNNDIIGIYDAFYVGADVNFVNENGNSILMIAVTMGCIDSALILINNAADLHKCNNVGDTILISACDGGYPDMVMMLIEKGADVNFANFEGITPLIAAVTSDNPDPDIVQMLIENDANIQAVNKDQRSVFAIAQRRRRFNLPKSFEIEAILLAAIEKQNKRMLDNR